MDFTHLDASGKARMVDVSGKDVTRREATAGGRIRMSRSCFEAVRDGAAQKGDVLGVARVAGIMAAKRAADLIPLCHSLTLTGCSVEFALHADTHEVSALCAVGCEGRTGAEMEALTGVSVALLTVYDMCKALDKSMEIHGVRLLEKSGGKSGRCRFGEKGAGHD